MTEVSNGDLVYSSLGGNEVGEEWGDLNTGIDSDCEQVSVLD